MAGVAGCGRRDYFAAARTARDSKRCCCTIWHEPMFERFLQKRTGSEQDRELRNGKVYLVGCGPRATECLP